MGTRNVTMVFADGAYKLAQYGQWDGYPEGQGKTALAFAREYLRTKRGRAAFRDRLARVRFVAQSEIERLFHAIDARGDDERNAEFRRRYPYFTRDNGAEILQMVWDAEGEVLTRNEFDFVRDSLMCEWAYVLDLDKGTFEVYRGFNTSPVPKGERFADMPVRDREYSNDQYYPVRHARTWALSDLPSEQAFVDDEAFKSKDEDE